MAGHGGFLAFQLCKVVIWPWPSKCFPRTQSIWKKHWVWQQRSLAFSLSHGLSPYVPVTEGIIHSFWLRGNTECHYREYFLRHKKSKVTEKKVTRENTSVVSGYKLKEDIRPQESYPDTNWREWRRERPFLTSIKTFFIYQALYGRAASTLNGHHSFLT